MFRPKIIGFVCNWCLPRGVEIPSPREMAGYPKMHLIQVMCVGGVDPVVVVDVLLNGADGVLLVGCPAPDCHHVSGNVQAENKFKSLRKLLSLTGLEPERLRLEWAYPTEIESFSAIVDDFRSQVIKLGPSPVAGERLDATILSNLLAAKNAAANFRLRVLTGREVELTEAANAYGEFTSQGEFNFLLDSIISEEFSRHKICLLTRQKPRSVKEIAATMKVQPAMILRQIVEMCRKRMIALDRVEGTTPLYKELEGQ
ncbi:MAG: hydrogenase iron-sulfur subunit [Candidatus Bathyarchaeota archaeon]|nr:MAG: hydrogenase iron-sulfur subunit [Candidatus Bathyarchaeota archaeon]